MSIGKTNATPHTYLATIGEMLGMLWRSHADAGHITQARASHVIAKINVLSRNCIRDMEPSGRGYFECLNIESFLLPRDKRYANRSSTSC